MSVHYIPRPTYDAAQTDKQKILVAACGERLMQSFTCSPRLVTCVECKRLMISEERPR